MIFRRELELHLRQQVTHGGLVREDRSRHAIHSHRHAGGGRLVAPCQRDQKAGACQHGKEGQQHRPPAYGSKALRVHLRGLVLRFG